MMTGIALKAFFQFSKGATVTLPDWLMRRLAAAKFVELTPIESAEATQPAEQAIVKRRPGRPRKQP